MSSSEPGKKARSHERIVDAASKAVRRAGFDGVSVASVMKDAGLTHGGFYSHFASREALLAEALGRASADTGAFMTSTIEGRRQRGPSAFRTFVETYLAEEQISSIEHGCPVAALCSEMPHQSADVLEASRRIVGNLHGLVMKTLPSGLPPEAAWSITSTLVGALQLARAFGPGDQAKAVLAAARVHLVAQYDPPR